MELASHSPPHGGASGGPEGASLLEGVSPHVVADLSDNTLLRIIGPRYARLRTREERRQFHRNMVVAMGHLARHAMSEDDAEAPHLKALLDKVVSGEATLITGEIG